LGVVAAIGDVVKSLSDHKAILCYKIYISFICNYL